MITHLCASISPLTSISLSSAGCVQQQRKLAHFTVVNKVKELRVGVSGCVNFGKAHHFSRWSAAQYRLGVHSPRDCTIWILIAMSARARPVCGNCATVRRLSPVCTCVHIERSGATSKPHNRNKLSKNLCKKLSFLCCDPCTNPTLHSLYSPDRFLRKSVKLRMKILRNTTSKKKRLPCLVR